MPKVSPFQAVVLAVFAVAAVGGLILLAITKGHSSGSGVPVVIWGTLPASDFNNAISDLTAGTNGLKINYVEEQTDSFDQNLIEALASGTGPDAILLPQDLIVKEGDKVAPIPYTIMPLPTFKSTFIQEGELYLGSNGILGMPFAVDPLVMYWNRDLLSNAGIAVPPKTWDEFLTLVPKLTVKDNSGNISQSGVAMGEFANIANAKDIIAALLLQTGNPIMTYGGTAGSLASTLTPTTLSSIGAINFYTDFADPVKPDYSWNRALPNSLQLFLAGKLAFYFGFASEASAIRAKNPNLNFDVTYFPQPKDAAVTTTFGRMWALALLRVSRNSDAQNDILALTADAPIAKWGNITGWPPVRRDLLSANPSDPYQSIFYDSALSARAWLDPNPAQSTAIFQNMIESITSGAKEVGAALDNAGQNLNNFGRQ
ncbi:extracellular solute-binding protein [Patescibacteria group bacterium]|nr:extracellular solute-binding protein [Patescibacteria group bacterium]